MINVNVEYFALLKDQRGCSEESVKTEAKTAQDFYQELQLRHKFSLSHNSLRVAINHEYKDWNTALSPNDTVVFISPVAGG